ncbi:DUF3881 family protein [Clostridiaceae bacterium]|nr:DUF3881 family protein [Clostridiaceae bacterium]RKI11394.1 DUF3881 family protein [bacterium 1XD21-70]
MHKFLRSVGFGSYQKKKEIARLLDELEEAAGERRRIQIEPDSNLCEIRAEVAPGMGIVIVGETNEEGVFCREYYYPYLTGEDVSSEVECTIQRHTEKETFGGLLDETRVGISLIFYLDNGFEYLERGLDQVSRKVKSVKLTGLSGEGKILLPLHKTRKQIEKAQVAAKDRSNLLEAARNGDEDAMETLTIEDIDMYSQISRRVMKEDIYSIVDSSFMPSGIECDQYTVIGEVVRVEEKTNRITEELVYDLTLNCNDMVFHVGIARKDLLGEPVVGRRFKGQIWMQGVVSFEEFDD